MKFNDILSEYLLQIRQQLQQFYKVAALNWTSSGPHGRVLLDNYWHTKNKHLFHVI